MGGREGERRREEEGGKEGERRREEEGGKGGEGGRGRKIIPRKKENIVRGERVTTHPTIHAQPCQGTQ